MTTLATNKPRAYELGILNDFPVIASDIIYEGAAVGIVAATGHARPLVAGDSFAGFANAQADNSAGAAAAINCNVQIMGEVEIAVTGVTITDVRQPVYATDDDTFTLNPIGATFVGFVKRFVSSGVAVIEFNAPEMRDPYQEYVVREAVTANFTTDIQDNGKLFWVTTDAVTITLAAVATPLNAKFVNGGSFGAVAINLSPNAVDRIQGPDFAGTDNKDLINTKATARRGDFVKLVTGDANGAIVSELRGIWATEA